MKRIVILGGGCGGLSVARALRFLHAQITLVDRRESHLVHSRLYAAAVSRVRQLEVGFNSLLRGQANVQRIRGEAVYLNARDRRLILSDRSLPYDTLVVAAGAREGYEREEWARFAPGLRTVEDAQRIRERLRDSTTTAVIAGGGVTGVELAAAIALADRNRRVLLLESGARLLPSFPAALAAEAQKRLRDVGVEVRCEAHMIAVDAESVRVSGAEKREKILTRAAFWAGGIRGATFAEALRAETGVSLDDTGRVCVQPDLTVSGYPEIFVLGDMARVLHGGTPLEGLATVAAQQGRYVASTIRERLAGYQARPFEYADQGRFVLIGRGGIGLIGDTRLSGATAWAAGRLSQKWTAPGYLVPGLRAYSAVTASRT